MEKVRNENRVNFPSLYSLKAILAKDIARDKSSYSYVKK